MDLIWAYQFKLFWNGGQLMTRYEKRNWQKLKKTEIESCLYFNRVSSVFLSEKSGSVFLAKFVQIVVLRHMDLKQNFQKNLGGPWGLECPFFSRFPNLHKKNGQPSQKTSYLRIPWAKLSKIFRKDHSIMARCRLFLLKKHNNQTILKYANQF